MDDEFENARRFIALEDVEAALDRVTSGGDVLTMKDDVLREVAEILKRRCLYYVDVDGEKIAVAMDY